MSSAHSEIFVLRVKQYQTSLISTQGCMRQKFQRNLLVHSELNAEQTDANDFLFKRYLSCATGLKGILAEAKIQFFSVFQKQT